MADDPPTTSDKAWENRDDKAWRKTGPVRKVVRSGQLALTRDADAPEEDAVYGSDIANRPKSAHLHHSSQDTDAQCRVSRWLLAAETNRSAHPGGHAQTTWTRIGNRIILRSCQL